MTKPPPVRQACILVGGKGTRLGELTRTVPKPLMAMGDGSVFLDILIDQVARHGCTDIVLLAGHLGEVVRERYHTTRRGGARIRVIVEPAPRGTAGALQAARDVLAPRFFLLNGDSFFNIDLTAFATTAGPAMDHEASMALRRVDDGSRYGSVVLDGARIVRFVEKKAAAGPAVINAGVYLLQADIVDRVHTLPCGLETDVFPLLAEERRLYGTICDGYFIDIGLPQSLEQARRELAGMSRVPK